MEKTKTKVRHSLKKEDVALTRLLAGADDLTFRERRKLIVDLINDMLIKAHGDQEGPVHLLPPVEMEEEAPATYQPLNGQGPVRRYTFNSQK